MGNIMDNITENGKEKVEEKVDSESNDSDESYSELYRCYYLLYKLKNSHIMWIARVSETLTDLTIIMEDFKSKIENYYIIKRNVRNIEEEFYFKQFTKFKKMKHDLIITQTD